MHNKALISAKVTNVGYVQAHDQLGSPGGANSFPRGAQIFGLYFLFLNFVQHIFPGGGQEFSRGLRPPCSPPEYGPVQYFYCLK